MPQGPSGDRGPAGTPGADGTPVSIILHQFSGWHTLCCLSFHFRANVEIQAGAAPRETKGQRLAA